MTVKYADISNHQPSFMSLKGELAVCAKASQGTGFTDPDYPAFKASAAAAGVFFFAYHFLDTSDPAAQAARCHAITGSTPLMVDMEETTGSEPHMRDMAGFVDAYRKLGGIVWLLYLPQWYWQKIGRPPMDPVTRRGLLLVSSHYGDPYTDADTGAGWLPYGGITPMVWQYTTTHPVNGVPVDYNAFRGTKAELVSLVTTGKQQSGPFRHIVPAGNTRTWYALAKAAGMTDTDMQKLTRSKLSPVNLAVFEALMALDGALHAAGLPLAAAPSGMVYWTSNK